jgi:hypothetical protein
MKQFDPGHHVNQLMIQVELPPYRGPHSPLDLVASEIVFGRMFEEFHHADIPAPTDDGKPLQKRQRRVSLTREMSALK